jgi:hypothetical protein
MQPQTARWTAPDLAVKVPGTKATESPWNLHPYHYANQAPSVLWDPDGQCSAPIGLQKGEVGICFEAFIADKYVGLKYVGRGDDRTFQSDDPKATARFQVQLRVAPTEKWQVIEERISSHRSGVFGKNTGPHGNLLILREGEGKRDEKGHTNLRYDVKALNGVADTNGYFLRFLTPRDLSEPIDWTLKLHFGLDGRVNIAGGSHDAFPSYGVYGYRMDDKGKVKSFKLYEFKETTVDKLAEPEDVEMQSTKPR